jgi:hypothetical protein
LSGEAVGEIVRERVEAAGLDPTGYSGHSLRAGLATSASQAGSQTGRSERRPSRFRSRRRCRISNGD